MSSQKRGQGRGRGVNSEEPKRPGTETKDGNPNIQKKQKGHGRGAPWKDKSEDVPRSSGGKPNEQNKQKQKGRGKGASWKDESDDVAGSSNVNGKFSGNGYGKPNLQKKQEGRGRGAPRKNISEDVPGTSKVKGKFSGGKPNEQKTQEGRERGAQRKDKSEDFPGTSKVKGKFSAFEQNRKGTHRETTQGKQRNQSPMSQGACGTSADERPTSHYSRGEHRGRGRGQPSSSNVRRNPPGNTQWQQPGKKHPKETKRSFPAPNNFKPPTQQRRHSTFRPGNEVSKNYPVLDHNVIQAMKENSCDEVVNRLSEGMSNLKFILSSQGEIHTSDEFNFNLICTLAIACDAPSSEKTTVILVALKGSKFFSTKVPTLLDSVQAKTTGFDEETLTKLIQGLIKIFFKYMRHLPSSYVDLPREQLQKALDQLKIEKKDELQKQLDAFKKERDEVIKEERQRHGKRYRNRKGEKPPNDFREMPVCPTNKEIVSPEIPFLRENITKGRYEDTEHYLDVQFRLLREDFLEPLREGIREITNKVPKTERKHMMKYYQGARVVGKIFTHSGIIYKLQFDASKFEKTRWAYSKRLIFGSFLCLSRDNFQTMLFATVANRDADELKQGRFDIRFIEEQDICGIEKGEHLFQMVESPAYFEAYRHVLKGLQELDKDSLPFKKYLVECASDVDPPEYLRRKEDQEPVYYNLSDGLGVPHVKTARRVPVLQPEEWPSVKELPLNSSQLEALKTAITTEFSVIQGPPGTGKTYVGAKIVQSLLKNRGQWDPMLTSPMLMVCYTNHALDQFLEKMLEFLSHSNIIRVGGRCKSQQLERCNLKKFAAGHRMGGKRKEIRDKMEESDKQIKQWKQRIVRAENQLLGFNELEELVDVRHTEQLYGAIFPPNVASECQRLANTFYLWLCNNEQMGKYNQSTETTKDSETEESQDGSILPGQGGEDDEVFYDAIDISTQHHVNESSYHNQLASSDGHLPGERRNVNRIGEVNINANLSMVEIAPSNVEVMLLSGSQSQATSHGPQERAITESQSPPQIKGKVMNNEQEEVQSSTLSEKSLQLESHQPEDDVSGKKVQTEDEKTTIETIMVEEQASLIRYERCMEGEEVFLPIATKQSDKEEEDEQDKSEVNLASDEVWTIVSYKKPQKLPWQKQVRGNSKGEETRVQQVVTEGRTGTAVPQTTTSSKNNKSKAEHKNKSKLLIKPTSGDISSIREKLQEEEMMLADEASSVTDIWLLSANDRLRLYLHWMECYRERHKIDIQRGEQGYEQLCSELAAVRAEEEEEILRDATVVGMTTSCAARYRRVLQRIAPKIVVIEEAAEVMEAHIITSLTRDTKHTILIGDHKQLRPKATVFELAQKYNLEISLFERMVTNKMDCKLLNIQHRMRPEIAELTKRIYGHEIVDHEKVCHFDDISGVSHNLFFINHCQREQLMGGLQSYSNPHEANFLVALCCYLLLQGYERHQITILTMYTGQLLELQQRMPRKEFGGVRVCAVDNFQGEENDIILLSLVRSNTDRRIGFLKEANRICVALSRARQGFYCIGNFGLLTKECTLWKEICADLQTKGAIGETLQLVCQRHKNRNDVKTSSDFKDVCYGGCGKPCKERLDCGHACDQPCHPSEEYHEKGWCSKTCFNCCPNGHPCQEKCHHPRACNECMYPVVKTIPTCGHEQVVPCSQDPGNFACRVKCERFLKCGHECKELCGSPCTDKCNVKWKKDLPCGHVRLMPCHMDPLVYSRCDENCERHLVCGHPCSKKCSKQCRCNTLVEIELPCTHLKQVLCSKKEETLQCMERCRRCLDCGHNCPRICHEKCSSYKCQVLVDKTLSCGHVQTLACHADEGSALCNAPCQRKLDCGHWCGDLCGRPCLTASCSEMITATLKCNHEQVVCCKDYPDNVQCKNKCGKKCERGHPCQKQCHVGSACEDCMVKGTITIPTCKHIFVVPCYVDPSTLVCNKRCERLRACKHPCGDICSKICASRPCTTLVTRTLHCKHSVRLPCHKNPDEYACKQKIDVELPCGHKKTMICSKVPASLEDERCDTEMQKELPCKHTATLPCYKTPEQYTCKEVIEATLPCGHRKSTNCSIVTSGLQDEICDVEVQRELPCKHMKTLPCYTKPEDYSCIEETEVSLDCGHTKRMICSSLTADFHDESCDVNVIKELPCKHKALLHCSDKPEKASCNAPCERLLSCEHPCPGSCSDDCSTFKCAMKVKRTLPCAGKHRVNLLCSDDVSRIVCPNKCTRKLQCGHPCPGKCAEECSQFKCRQKVLKEISCPGKHRQTLPCFASPSTVVCQKSCQRKLECGHSCPRLCSEDCRLKKCIRKINKHFSCGHTATLRCFEGNAAICKLPCQRTKDSCQHICSGICGEPCSKYPCKVPVVKELPCGHRIKMFCVHFPESVRCPASCGAQLQCGHNCPGTCFDCQQRGSHELCHHPCGRLLVCSHRCEAICSEPCPPCGKPCRRRCPHGRCTQLCSEPCRPCQLPCTWSCPHYQCNNLCGEICDRPPCNARCSKLLSCRHPCIGLCGEHCPTVCRLCNKKQLPTSRNKDENASYMQLFDCGHVVKVDEMDAWMRHDLGSVVQLRRCPKCSTSITFSYRYENHIKRTLVNLESVKTQMQGLTHEAASSANKLRRNSALIIRSLSFPQQVLALVWQPSALPRNALDHLKPSIMPLIFTLKNHLQILFEIQRTHRLLTDMECQARLRRKPTTDQASLQRKSEIEELSVTIQGALKEIEEFLEKPHLDLDMLSQAYEHARKFFLFLQIVKTEHHNDAIWRPSTARSFLFSRFAKEPIARSFSFSTAADTSLRLAKEKFHEFLQGNNDALDLEWLEEIVNLLRKEVKLPALPDEKAKDFENFPGFSKGVWKLCEQGHVYVTRSIVRGSKDPAIQKGCRRCETMNDDQEELWMNVN